MSGERLDFSLPYERMQQTVRKGLLEARAAGRTVYQTSQSAREVDPTRLSLSQIDVIALREAQRYTERAINKHNMGEG